MKKLTKRQRVEVYKLAQKIFHRSIMDECLCSVINDALDELHPNYGIIHGFDNGNQAIVFSKKYRPDHFPEFHSFDNGRAYWWASNDRTSRLKALDRLIQGKGKND